MSDVQIRLATERDVPVIVALITALAEYERLTHEVKATEIQIRESLFGAKPHAEAAIAWVDGTAAGFALWFHNYSTFLARPGLYLEDLFVLPEWRSKGIGRALLSHLARIAVERGCGRMEWAVLDWNDLAIRFYRGIGAAPVDGWSLFRLTGPALARLADARE